MSECLKEACGVFAAQNFDSGSIFQYLYLGLRAQNHRGHQSYGFITYQNGEFYQKKRLGLVPQLEKKKFQKWQESLPGPLGTGNVRYTTSGGMDEKSLIKGIQPFLSEGKGTGIAIAFNGNVVNVNELRENIQKKLKKFSYECDGELICKKLHIEAMKDNDLAASVKKCMKEVEGAFSVAGITKKGELFAFKDPYGIKPLCCGHSEDNKTCAVSSETVGLDINSFEHDFEIEPGELVIATKNGFEREQVVQPKKRALCAFEFAYFARPDSKLGKRFVYEVREEFGRNLATEYPEIAKNADIIISIPETADDAAYGLHEATDIRWERATRRHRYVTERAFILLPEERQKTIDRKINILGSKIRGKNVVVTEDSIVRGDTTKVAVGKIRKMRAEKVYLFVTFPRIIGPCFYGIDMTTYGELIGSRYKPDQIAEIIGADGVCYQSLDGFVRSTGLSKDSLCLGCVTGRYPTPSAQKIADRERKEFEKGHIKKRRVYEQS